MNQIKEKLSQMVQDVLDGEESAIKANYTLMIIKSHINKCQKIIEDLIAIESQTNGDSKDNN